MCVFLFFESTPLCWKETRDPLSQSGEMSKCQIGPQNEMKRWKAKEWKKCKQHPEQNFSTLPTP